MSRIDVLVILHNCRMSLPDFLSSLKRISIPVRFRFLDNNSQDDSPNFVARSLPDLPFPATLLRSTKNNGFARGMNLLAEQSDADYIFILNPDTEIEEGCLELLVSRAESDCRIGICEARQSPREHPKTFDSATGETSWCSGAAALIRRTAFEEVGGFDDRLYFMYCEDVDLSWKFWLKGWRCIYIREAVVQHFTQDLTPGKRRTAENYFTFRNSLFLFYRFGSWEKRPTLRRFFLKRFFSSAYTVKSKVLFTIALLEHIRYIPYLLQTRGEWSGQNHPWVRFEETSLSS